MRAVGLIDRSINFDICGFGGEKGRRFDISQS